jgi:uncharacterized membrane protein YhaH (DUF805 family)
MEMVRQPNSAVELITMSNGDNNTQKYWFPANRYGWGRGMPSAWQGWVILIVYTGTIVAGAFIFPPQEERTLFIILTVVLTLILIVVCWGKGQPPRWRWGDDKKT